MKSSPEIEHLSRIHSRMPLIVRANTSSIASDNKKETLWLFITGPNTVRIYIIGETGRKATNTDKNINV